METPNSYKTKLSRRKKRYSAMLLKETGLKEIPKSRFLMVCNAGLVSGLELEKLVQYFSQYCSLQNVLMIPGKSYCFVQCFTESEAEKAYHEINGKLTLPEANGPLYLLYCESFPQRDIGVNFHYKPSGLLLDDNFISEDEEKLLIDIVHKEFENSSNTLKHRLVKHYGYEFDYKTNNVDKSNQTCEPIPASFKFLFERITRHDKLINWVPNQITINCYQPGQGIPFHVDTHSAFDDYILSLSVGSDIVMEFKKDGKRCCILLKRKSLLIMTDECRYAWNHGIVPRKYDVIETSSGLTTQARNVRISFTFRRIRNEDSCNCSFDDYCDTRLNVKNHSNSLTINNTLASELEKVHVHEVYDVIADHFSETRHKPWPNVENFIKSFEPGSIFIDVGCGNGKYLGINKSVFQVGCDRSTKLTQECFKKGFDTLICDCLELPFRSGIADFCICIAVIHHLATEERRIQAIEEIVRVLKAGGQALIYVWAKNQEQNEKPSSYLMQNKNVDKPENLNDTRYSVKLNGFCDDNEKDHKKDNHTINEISLPVHINRTQFKHEDMLVPWKLKPKGKECVENVPTFLRFYHVFSKGELESLCEKVPRNKIVKSYYDQGNWCVIFKKL